MQLERTTRSAWVESLALLTSLTCDSTQADRVVRPIRIRCKLWGGEGHCESKAHDYNYCWPGLEPKSLDPESRAFAAVSPTTRTTKVTEVSPTTFSLCVMKLNVNFNQILSTQFFSVSTEFFWVLWLVYLCLFFEPLNPCFNVRSPT